MFEVTQVVILLDRLCLHICRVIVRYGTHAFELIFTVLIVSFLVGTGDDGLEVGATFHIDLQISRIDLIIEHELISLTHGLVLHVATETIIVEFQCCLLLR